MALAPKNGRQFVQWRRSIGLDQTDCAMMLGLSRRTMVRIESDADRPISARVQSLVAAKMASGQLEVADPVKAAMVEAVASLKSAMQALAALIEAMSDER